MAPFQHNKVKATFVDGLRLTISAKIIFNFQSLSKPGPRPPCFRDQAHLSYFVENIIGNISANLYSILVIGVEIIKVSYISTLRKQAMPQISCSYFCRMSLSYHSC